MFAYVHWIFVQSQFKFETVWIFIQHNLCIEFGVTFKIVSICVGSIIPVSYVYGIWSTHAESNENEK